METKGQVFTAAETGKMQLQAKGHEGCRKSLSERLWGGMALWPLDLRLPACRTVREPMCLSCLVCGILLLWQRPWELVQVHSLKQDCPTHRRSVPEPQKARLTPTFSLDSHIASSVFCLDTIFLYCWEHKPTAPQFYLVQSLPQRDELGSLGLQARKSQTLTARVPFAARAWAVWQQPFARHFLQRKMEGHTGATLRQ